MFVIFYGYNELQGAGWRDMFLKSQLARWSVPYVDTKEVLLHSAQTESRSVSDYYHGYAVWGHLNERGYEIMAKAITGHMVDHVLYTHETTTFQTPASANALRASSQVRGEN